MAEYLCFSEREAEENRKIPLTADERIELDPLGENEDRRPRTVAVLGNFDGVHKGHATLVKSARSIKSVFGGARLVLYSFSDLKKGEGCITPPEKKAELLMLLGAEAVILDSIERVKELSPEDFVKKVLREELNAESVFCGYNYRFGRNAEGDAQALRELCVGEGISCSVQSEVRLPDPGAKENAPSSSPSLPPLSFGMPSPGGFSPMPGMPAFPGSAQRDDGKPTVPVSSTGVRDAIKKGDIEMANFLLGRNFSLIPEADGNGGFLIPEGMISLSDGEYLCLAGGKEIALRVNGRALSFENGDLSGEIEFIKKI